MERNGAEPPWVRVPHLASHVLGQITRLISADWMQKYGHPTSGNAMWVWGRSR